MKVQVWSVISRRGSSDIFASTNNLNGQGYFGILANHLIPFAKSYYGNDAILYQENSAIHKEANCKALLISNNLNWERCPPYSPDMNPIEKLWADLKEFIANCRCQNDDQTSKNNKIILNLKSDLNYDMSFCELDTDSSSLHAPCCTMPLKLKWFYLIKI